MADLEKDQKRRISKGIARGTWTERDARKYAKGGVAVNKLKKMAKRTFMGRIAEKAEEADRERTGQSGRHFSKRFDEVLGKKHK